MLEIDSKEPLKIADWKLYKHYSYDDPKNVNINHGIDWERSYQANLYQIDILKVKHNYRDCILKEDPSNEMESFAI